MSLPSGLTWILWSENGHPARLLKRVFDTTLQDYHFQIQLRFLKIWVSSGVVSPFITGYRRPIYSQLTVKSPDRVAVDQKAIRINDEQYWLYAAVDPETNRFLHSRLFPTYTIPIAREFLTELSEKHDVEDAVFLVDDADDLIGGLRREGYSYRVQQHGFRNSIERVFREVERRTSSFSNCFSHVDPATAETWLQAHAVWWNHA